ncbi:MAG: hypothetical protein MZV70_51520 [Desulfobacterales bacterium]|nr:hypothetical protein [Desulfobacterales bacterium]
MVGFFGAGGLMPAGGGGGGRPAAARTARHPLRRQPDPQPRQPRARNGPGGAVPATEGPAGQRLRLCGTQRCPWRTIRVKGIHRDADGRIVCPNRIVAKVSRVEVARKFLAPPAGKHLAPPGRRAGCISAEEAALAAAVPLADDADGRGRFRRPHRQPPGHNPAADDAGAAGRD